MTRFLVIFLLSIFSSSVFSDVRMASWNIKHFGWNNDKNEIAVAAIASGFDFLAIQEVMDSQAISRMESNLEKLTNESWSHMVSHEVGRGRYQEMYAFIWRDSEVDYYDGAALYLDPEDKFIREPYSARFLDVDSNNIFLAASVHILFGDSISDREPEIKFLTEYWQWLSDSFPESKQNIVLMGDFNLPPNHEAWDRLKSHAKPLITKGKTTLSTSNGRYTSLYDNLWVSKDTELNHRISGVFTFPSYMESITGDSWTNKQIRSHISDHVPVFTLIDAMDIPTVSIKTRSKANTYNESKGIGKKTCIDINEDTKSKLTNIPYIGNERADDVISLRPWASISELIRINGIGKKTLEKIIKSNVICEI